MRRPDWLTPAVLTILAAGAVMMSVSMGSRKFPVGGLNGHLQFM
jgi:hypothetical protein